MNIFRGRFRLHPLVHGCCLYTRMMVIDMHVCLDSAMIFCVYSIRCNCFQEYCRILCLDGVGVQGPLCSQKTVLLVPICNLANMYTIHDLKYCDIF